MVIVTKVCFCGHEERYTFKYVFFIVPGSQPTVKYQWLPGYFKILVHPRHLFEDIWFHSEIHQNSNLEMKLLEYFQDHIDQTLRFFFAPVNVSNVYQFLHGNLNDY